MHDPFSTTVEDPFSNVGEDPFDGIGEDPFENKGEDPFGEAFNENGKEEKEPFSSEFNKEMFGDVETNILSSTPTFKEEVRDEDTKEEDYIIEEDFERQHIEDTTTQPKQSRPDPFKMKKEPEDYKENTNYQDFTNKTQESTKNKEDNDTFYSGFSYGMSILGFIYIIQSILELI